MLGLTEIEMDVCVGGSFRFATNQVEALPGMHTESGKYKVIESNKRIEKNWNYEGPMSPDKTLNSEIILRFIETQTNVTKVILRQNGSCLSNVDIRNQAKDKWTHALIELATLLK